MAASIDGGEHFKRRIRPGEHEFGIGPEHAVAADMRSVRMSLEASTTYHYRIRVNDAGQSMLDFYPVPKP